MRVKNQGRINYEYLIGQNRLYMKDTQYSNTVITLVLEDRVKVNKQVDKGEVCPLEYLTYTIRVENIGDREIDEIQFQDYLPRGVQYVHNSVYINDKKRRCINPMDGFILPPLLPGEEMLISFKVRVLPKGISSSLKNRAQIEYGYVYEEEMPPLHVAALSNEVMVNVKNRIFQQRIHLSKFYFNCPQYRGVEFQIQQVAVRPIQVKSIQKWHTDQLLVIGEITYCILGIQCRTNQSRGFKRIEGFSQVLTLPNDAICGCIGEVYIDVEDVTMQYIEKGMFVISVAMLTGID